jgi:hypothetical protein
LTFRVILLAHWTNLSKFLKFFYEINVLCLGETDQTI